SGAGGSSASTAAGWLAGATRAVGAPRSIAGSASRSAAATVRLRNSHLMTASDQHQRETNVQGFPGHAGRADDSNSIPQTAASKRWTRLERKVIRACKG